MKRFVGLFIAILLITTVSAMANPVRKTIQVDGFEREYLIYIPSHPFSDKPDGMMVCLHGFGRTMNDFFGEYNISSIADALNLIIVTPQALPEQDSRVIIAASILGTVTDNQISLHSVWGCGLRVCVTELLFGMVWLDEELNKEVDDVNFIDLMIDEVLSDYSLPAKNIFMLGTSMGGYMTYQYALKKGERLSGIVSIAGSMGLEIKGMDNARKIPVCDFHSLTDEVVPYTGSYEQYAANIALAKPMTEVINYWRETNATGDPVTEQIRYYPSTNGITVEKITYPDPDNEVIHYRMNGAPHSYFFRKENGDCMDHVEEISRFILSHHTETTPNTPVGATHNLTFYPNPVDTKIYFTTPNGIFTIYDMAGRALLTRTFMNGQADLSLLKSGIYFIRIQTGNTIRVDKLIVR